MEPLRISVLVSGNGTDLQSVIDAVEDGSLPHVKICQVISDRVDAPALERAREHDIPALAVTQSEYNDVRDRNDAILRHLDGEHTELVVLAGYLSILPPKVIRRYAGKIINIHPSLLPRHGGKGHYGLKVHEEVLRDGDRESGCTVHYVDEGIDTGEILMQEKVPVKPDDTPETLQARVLKTEHQLLPKAIGMIEKGRH